ncbi:hypothetical protein TcWFU_001585 [Taenia crassiceps]|uniref:Uncharacterized protein n=1 Tax=Taenia crassiceps TaxID=6207 RepID=A0ABR4QB81_9CEST
MGKQNTGFQLKWTVRGVEEGEEAPKESSPFAGVQVEWQQTSAVEDHNAINCGALVCSCLNPCLRCHRVDDNSSCHSLPQQTEDGGHQGRGRENKGDCEVPVTCHAVAGHLSPPADPNNTTGVTDLSTGHSSMFSRFFFFSFEQQKRRLIAQLPFWPQCSDEEEWVVEEPRRSASQRRRGRENAMSYSGKAKKGKATLPCHTTLGSERSQCAPATAKSIRHLLDFSRLPFGWKAKRLREERKAVLPPLAEECMQLAAERAAPLMDGMAQVTRPRISIQPFNARHIDVVTKYAQRGLCNVNGGGVETNAAVVCVVSEDVLHFTRAEDNLAHHSLVPINDTTTCSRVHVSSREEGRTGEAVREVSFTPALLVSVESVQGAATLHPHRQSSRRCVACAACISFHNTSAVRHAPAAQVVMGETAPDGWHHVAYAPPPPTWYEMPPERMSTPASPYVAADTALLGKHGRPATPPSSIWSVILKARAQEVASTSARSPRETMQQGV